MLSFQFCLGFLSEFLQKAGFLGLSFLEVYKKSPTYICSFLPAELASCNDWSKSDFTRVVFPDRCVDWTKPVVFPVGATIAEVRLEAHAKFQE